MTTLTSTSLPIPYTAPLADLYRGPYRADDPQAGAKYAAAVQAVIERMAVDGKAPGAFIAESCPSVGGQIIFPAGYLAGVYAHVRAAGGLTIADEVARAHCGRLDIATNQNGEGACVSLVFPRS